jgi:hypothetical protein
MQQLAKEQRTLALLLCVLYSLPITALLILQIALT